MNPVPFDQFNDKVKAMVISACDMKNVTVGEINDDEMMINGALPLDSLDALEIVTKIKEHFHIKVENASTAHKLFRSFRSLSGFLHEKADPNLINRFMSIEFKEI